MEIEEFLKVHGKLLPNDFLGSIQPEKILYEFDMPLIFTSLNNQGLKLLVYAIDIGPNLDRYLVVESSDQIIHNLQTNKIDMHSALNQKKCWVVEFYLNNQIKNIWEITFDNLPKDYIVESGVFLKTKILTN